MHRSFDPVGHDTRPLDFDTPRRPSPLGTRAGAGAGTVASAPAAAEDGRRFGESDDRVRRLRARGFGVLAVLAGAAYLALLPGSLNPATPIASWAFFAAELGLLALFALAVVDLWTLRFKPSSGRPTSRPRAVDVFIHVSDEPPGVVERALTSAACLEWSGPLAIHLVDESGSLGLQVRARELGFEYLSPTRGTGRSVGRAAALNHALAHSSGELVFVLDADHLVRPEALVAMAGYLDLARVAFVQSKHAFAAPGGDPFHARDAGLSDAVQMGFEHGHSVISCGSTALYSRMALEDVGGFADWNLGEDLATSYELHSRGWKSLYFPYPMSRGLAPGNVAELYRQRLRRAADALRIFLWDNPLLKRGLSWRSRLDHFVVGLGYLWAALFLPVFFLIPIWCWATGSPLLVRQEGLVVLMRLAYFGLFALASSSLLPGRGVGSHFRFLSGLFPVYLGGLVEALRSPPGRRPAPALARRPRRQPLTAALWLALIPQLLIVTANLTLPVWALARHTASTWMVATNLLLSAVVVWALWPLLFHGLRQRGAARDVAGRRRFGPGERVIGGTL